MIKLQGEENVKPVLEKFATALPETLA